MLFGNSHPTKTMLRVAGGRARGHSIYDHNLKLCTFTILCLQNFGGWSTLASLLIFGKIYGFGSVDLHNLAEESRE